MAGSRDFTAFLWPLKLGALVNVALLWDTTRLPGHADPLWVYVVVERAATR